MGIKILKGIIFGFVGLFADLVLLIVLSFAFPEGIGGWIDGIPLGLLFLIPPLLLGSLIGLTAGLLLSIQKDSMSKGGFMGSMIGGIIGVLIGLLLLQF